MCTPPKDSRFVRLPYCIFEGSVEIKVIARNSASKETLRAHFVSQWLAALEGPVLALLTQPRFLAHRWLPLVFNHRSLSKEIPVDSHPPWEGSALCVHIGDTWVTEILSWVAVLRRTQTCRKNKAFRFCISFHSFFWTRLWIICLRNTYMPFAFNLYLHGLTLTFWLHFGFFFFF